jgi:hypothetical protein
LHNHAAIAVTAEVRGQAMHWGCFAVKPNEPEMR